MALAQTLLLPKTDYRDGERLLFWRRFHTTDSLRFCDCRRGCDLWAERSQLGYFSRRVGEPGFGGRDVLPRRHVGDHDRRSVRRQESRGDEADQLRRAERKIARGDDRPGAETDEKEPAGA